MGRREGRGAECGRIISDYARIVGMVEMADLGGCGTESRTGQRGNAKGLGEAPGGPRREGI